MNLLCFDLEGVLAPEIWVHVAKKTGLQELQRTTRDEPIYEVLMESRLNILKEHKISLQDIQDVIATLPLLDGAKEFFNWARSLCQVVIITDSFVQFISPLIEKLGKPLVLCNELNIDNNGMIIGYKLRQHNQKTQAVKAFQDLNYTVTAIGDSYNDIGMLQQADHGILFCPPRSVQTQLQQFPVAGNYNDLIEEIVQLFEY